MSRHLLLAVAAIWLAVQATPASAEAVTMQATMYDDGLACPGNCDAHVVFARKHNGTENAFAPPMANRQDAAAHPCVSGEACMVCFEAADTSCIEVTYRGSGPSVGRFDFSSAFMLSACTRAHDLPPALSRQCQAMEREAAAAYGGKLSCIGNPEDERCQSIVAPARADQAADRPEFLACEQVGPAAYNATQPEPKRHRSIENGCAYAENLRERNSNGDTWQRLMPGACRDGTFVGRDGLDCCIGEPLVDASYGRRECAVYYR